jgi:hypothetical protein
MPQPSMAFVTTSTELKQASITKKIEAINDPLSPSTLVESIQEVSTQKSKSTDLSVPERISINPTQLQIQADLGALLAAQTQAPMTATNEPKPS